MHVVADAAADGETRQDIGLPVGMRLDSGDGVVDRQQFKRPESRMFRAVFKDVGVTAVVISMTSPLGKLLLPRPLNHWLGSLVCDGRERPNASPLVGVR